MTPVEAAVGIGSNLNDPASQVRRAIEALDGLAGTRLLRASGLYRSAPQGPRDQPDYVNACAVVETTLAPQALLEALQGIEQAFGRVRKRHWGERVIDLDLLLYGTRQIETPTLTVPHPMMRQRDFVLVPLAQIAPDWPVPPDDAPVSTLARSLRQHYLKDEP